MHTWGWAEPWYPQPRRDSDEATRWKQDGGWAGRAGKGPERVLGINRVRHAKGEAAKGEDREAWPGRGSGRGVLRGALRVHPHLCPHLDLQPAGNGAGQAFKTPS